MVKDDGKKKDKFDFDAAGEEVGYISLDQARVLAMRTARDAPGDYGPRYAGFRMVYTVVEQQEGEDYYTVTLAFRPEGDFVGTEGREQFFIEKDGSVDHRQVLSLPRLSRRFPVVLIAISLVVVAVGIGGWSPASPRPNRRRRRADTGPCGRRSAYRDHACRPRAVQLNAHSHGKRHTDSDPHCDAHT